NWARRSEVDDRAGEGAGDALDGLDARHHQLAQRVDVVCCRLDDDVVGAGHVVGGVHAGDLTDFFGHQGGLTNLRLDQHVRLDHYTLLEVSNGGLYPARTGCVGAVQYVSWPARTLLT